MRVQCDNDTSAGPVWQTPGGLWLPDAAILVFNGNNAILLLIVLLLLLLQQYLYCTLCRTNTVIYRRQKYNIKAREYNIIMSRKRTTNKAHVCIHTLLL